MNLSQNCTGFLAELEEALQSFVCEGPQFKLNGFKGKILLIGNGGSAAVASHIANDLTKIGYRALSLTDSAILTCLANDEGYIRIFDKWIKVHQEVGDIVIAISSSGASVNILLGCARAKKLGPLITFTGFDPDNPVREMGETNYWVPSHNYGVVEIVHLAILHGIVNPGSAR